MTNEKYKYFYSEALGLIMFNPDKEKILTQSECFDSEDSAMISFYKNNLLKKKDNLRKHKDKVVLINKEIQEIELKLNFLKDEYPEEFI